MSEKLYSCIMLSGGMSRRMGEDKGSMIIQGKPMILHILERLNGKINDAVIVLNNQERINSYNELLNAYVPVKIEENFTYSLGFIEDEVKDKGPVAGIMTGLKNIKTERTFSGKEVSEGGANEAGINLRGFGKHLPGI